MKTIRVLLLIAVVWSALPITVSAFYNPSTGRWLSRDPIGISGGLNIYGFVGNDAQGSYDFLGLEDLVYESVAKTFIDGRLGGYTVERGFSGHQFSPSAWYWQFATQINCPGGLCNSGNSPESQNSSFVRAKVTLRSKCPRIVECSCRVSYTGSTVIPKAGGKGGGTPGAGVGGFTVKGHVLDKPIYRRIFPEDIGTEWAAVGGGNETEVKRFILAPYKSKQLYLGYIIVSLPVDWPGSSFVEQMSGDCFCSIIR